MSLLTSRLRAAYDENLRDYRDTIPQLFWPNAFVVLSNGAETRVGGTFSQWEQFGKWKRIDTEGACGRVQLETAIRGLCERTRLLDVVGSFVAYTEQPGGLVKSLARYHQLVVVHRGSPPHQPSIDGSSTALPPPTPTRSGTAYHREARSRRSTSRLTDEHGFEVGQPLHQLHRARGERMFLAQRGLADGITHGNGEVAESRAYV